MLGLEALIMQCAPDVAPSTMMAIITVESKGNPWVIGNNTLKAPIKPAPKSKEDAIRVAKYYLSLGHSLDLGLAQINSKNLNRLGLSLEEVFDPCTNVAAGAMILKDFYLKASAKYGDGQKALMHALSGYNTGSLYRGHSYVTKVVQAANNGLPVNVPSLNGGAVDRAIAKKPSKPTKYSQGNNSEILVGNNFSGLILQ